MAKSGVILIYFGMAISLERLTLKFRFQIAFKFLIISEFSYLVWFSGILRFFCGDSLLKICGIIFKVGARIF